MENFDDWVRFAHSVIRLVIGLADLAGRFGPGLSRLFQREPQPVDVEPGTVQGVAGSAALAIEVQPGIVEVSGPMAVLNVEVVDSH